METALLKRLAAEQLGEDVPKNKWVKNEGKGRTEDDARDKPFRGAKGRSKGSSDEGETWLLHRLAALVLRHEDSLAVLKLDKSFVIHFRVDGPGAMLKSIYMMSQTWKSTKATAPSQLSMPLRAVIFQHVFKTLLERWEKTLADETLKTEAVKLGWLKEDLSVPYQNWDAASSQLVASSKPAVPIRSLLEGIQQNIISAANPDFIKRFHATRPLVEAPKSTITFLLEVGGAQPSEVECLRALNQMSESALWAPVAASMKKDRLMRSSLAQQIAKEVRA